MTRILFISDIAATTEFAAGTIFKIVIEQMPENWVVDQAVIGSPSLRYNLNPYSFGNVFYTQKPNAQWFNASSNFLAAIGQDYVERFEINPVKRWLQKIVQQGNYDKVVLAFQCQVLTSILTRTDFGRTEVISFMWDHPSWWAREHKLSTRTRKRFTSQWFSLLNNSDSVILPSESARSLLSKEFKGRIHVLYPSIPNFSEDKGPRTLSNLLRIGFAGSTYAMSEIKDFTKNLLELNRSSSGLELELHLFSKSNPFEGENSVIQRGWWDPEETTKALSMLDFAFLPYPSSVEMRDVALTSFPSKMSLYVSAKLPIIYVGPEGTAVENFILENKIGVVSTKANLEASIRTLLESYGDMAQNLEVAYGKHFSKRALLGMVREIFSVEQNQEPTKVSARSAHYTQSNANSNGIEKNQNRVRALSWEMFNTNSVDQGNDVQNPGPVEYHTWISLSKYLYYLLVPGLVFAELRSRFRPRFNFGLFLTRFFLGVFRVLARLYRFSSVLKSRCLSTLRRISRN